MAIGFEDSIGIQDQALSVLERRMQLLSSNLANADTPGFKARDLDFRAALEDAGATALRRTDDGHMTLGGGAELDAHQRYRTSSQPSLDGNTVDENVEKTAFAEAAVRYESTLSFLSRRISGLKSAFRVG